MERKVVVFPCMILAAALLASAGLALAMQGRAEASFPGQNGGIVFTSFRGWEESASLYSRDPNTGEFTRLTNTDIGYVRDSKPAVSPDGTRVVFYKWIGTSDVYAVNTDGTGLSRITNTPSWIELGAVWSPDGRKIAFVSYSYDSQSGQTGDREIYVMDADGTDRKRITDNDLEERDIEWSPDGTRMAFAASDLNSPEIYVVKADGTEASKIASGDGPSWSPDGAKLAFSRCSSSWGVICTINPDGTGQQDIVTDRFDDNPDVESVYDYDPSWSPDGTKIAFARSINFFGSTDGDGVYTMNADGSDLKAIAGYFPRAVSPDWGPTPGTRPSPTAPPETTIISGPSGTRGTTATFDFVSSSLDSSFECSLDGADFAPCEGSKNYSDLPGGEHTFAVRAKNAVGTDQSAATRTWTVDATAPKGRVVINGGRASTANRKVTLAMSANDGSSGVAAMRIGGGGTGGWSDWRPYAKRATMTLRGRAGKKTVHVRYRDGVGNVSSASDRIVYRP